jgi:transposase InsO family protein
LQSDFDSFCKEHDIQHIMGGIGKPTTPGKIERWHRTHMIWKNHDSKDMSNSSSTMITKEYICH